MANSRTYHYELKIGDISEKGEPCFEFENIKETISVRTGCIRAKGECKVELSSDDEKKMEDAKKEQRLEERFDQRLFFIIKKLNFIYFLKFGKILMGEYDISFFEEQKKESRRRKTIKLEQWIPDFKILFLPEYLRTNENIKKIAKQEENDFNRIMACVVNFNYAKQKENTVENALDCFTYYWSSFNSLYYFCSAKNGEKGDESKKMNFFAKRYIDSNYNPIRTHSVLFDRMGVYLSAFVLNEWDGKPVTKEMFKEDRVYRAFSERIEGLYREKQESSAYVHLLVTVSYKCRNDFMHGNKALPILNMNNDIYNPKVICFLNYLIDDFISNNMILILGNIDSSGGSGQAQPAAAQQNATSD